MPGSAPGPGQIVYSNGYALRALARHEGAETIDLGVAADTVEATALGIRRARLGGEKGQVALRLIRLADDDAHLLVPHQPDHRREMRRARLHARLRLDEARDVQAEAAGEIGPAVVIGDESPALQRRHAALPIGELGLEDREKPLAVALEFFRMLWIETAERFQDGGGDDLRVFRVEPVMRVAVAMGVPVGLGSHTGWDTRLDGRLAQAVMCVNAVKAVEIGRGVRIAYTRGSQAHDEIAYDNQQRRFYHLSNRAGGIEGGITNGEEVRVVGYVKPIPTLKKALRSVDLVTKEPFLAQHERSDTCTVPAAGVIGESMVALVLATAFLEKFGGDSIEETRRNHKAYLDQLQAY